MENNKINIAEILRDCPAGTELYSPLCGICVFDRLNMGTIICKKQNTQEIAFTSEGYYMLPVFDNCECMIFPSKDQRDWSKFQRLFKDGDILACNQVGNKNPTIYIYYHNEAKRPMYYIALIGGNKLKIDKDVLFSINENTIRFATEEEKRKLFQVIKENGYRWNEETKTLETLIKPKFKVGDKVKCWINGYCSISTIEDMQWDRSTNEIKYKILDYFYSTMNIQPYKEEIMEVDVNDNKTLLNMSAIDYNNGLVGYEIPVGYEFDTVINNKVVLKKLKPQYPKTFIEVLDFWNPDRQIEDDYQRCYKKDIIGKFQNLLYARGAYWKIAGEQMKLGKPWEPDYDSGVNKYGIICMNGVVQKSNPTTNWERHLNKVLDFPTEEMRDIFFENFKDLIEACKELL